MEREKLPMIRMATKLPLPLDGLIVLRLLRGDLSTKVWFRIVTKLAVDILLGTSFIDHLIGAMELSISHYT